MSRLLVFVPVKTRSVRRRVSCIAAAVFLSLLPNATALADDEPVATITVSSATAGSSFGRLVEGVMRFRGNDYRLTLRGVTESARTGGSVYGLLRPRDIEGVFQPSDQGLRNASGVTIRFDPPLALGAAGLEIEVSSRFSPKNSGGQHGSGVE